MKVVILIAVLLALGVWVLWRRRSNAASPTEPTADEERSLAEQLSTGEAGLKWEVPSTWDFVSSNGNVAEWIDREQGLHWHLAIAFFGLDASEQHLDLLRQDIERQAQDEFEPNTPRTRQQGWSPVISVKLVRVDGVGAVEIVRRLTYQPGNEIVEGQVMIPLAGGTALITVTSRAAITGLREVLLSMAEMEKRDETDGWPELTQEQIDDPSLDEFDEEGMSPIAAVRRAVGWLVAADGACLRVTQPSEVFSSDVVALPDAKCSIIPPPRYVKVPERFPRGDSQNVLFRVGLGACLLSHTERQPTGPTCPGAWHARCKTGRRRLHWR